MTGEISTKPKVLVVDDDRSICKLMGSILEMESYPFRVANSGEQARRAMGEEKFDILVSDIYLGDASGLQLLEHSPRCWMAIASGDSLMLPRATQPSWDSRFCRSAPFITGASLRPDRDPPPSGPSTPS